LLLLYFYDLVMLFLGVSSGSIITMAYKG
jgi:hypothetical protein